jgi:hypothetical protein
MTECDEGFLNEQPHQCSKHLPFCTLCVFVGDLILPPY